MDHFQNHQRYVQRPPNFPDSPNCFHHMPPPPPPPHPNLHPPLPPPHHYHHRLPPPPPPPHPHHGFPFHSHPHPENPHFFDFIQHRDSPPTPHSMRTLDPWSDLAPRFPLPPPPHHHQPPFFMPLNEQNDSSRFNTNDFVSTNNGFRGNRPISNQETSWGQKDSELDRPNFDRPIQHRRDIRDDREKGLKRGHGDVNSDSSSRSLPLDNSNASDLRRFSNRAREGIEEFHRSPRNKHVQKRSGPHRIQIGKDSHRTRSQDWHFSRGFVDNSRAAGSRGKEKDGHAWSGKRVEERENSPVELDVSFKSNSLVAKAIVAPSSPAVEYGKNITPRVRKIRRLNTSDSPPTKSSEDLGKCENLANGPDCPLRSEKDPTELVNNPSGSEKASNSASNVCTPTKNLVLDQGTNGVQNDRTPLRKIRYKTEVMSSITEENSLLQKEAGVNPVSADISANNLFSFSETDEGNIRAEERIVSDGMNEVQDSFSADHSTEELSANKIYEPSEPVVSCSNASMNDSGSPFNSKIKGTYFSVISVSESQVGTEVKEHAVHERKLLENCPMFDSETRITELQKNLTAPIINKDDDAKEQHHQDHDSMSKTNLVQESNGCHACSSSSEETIIHKDDMSIHSLTEDACAASESLLGFSERTENIVAEVGSVHAVSEQSFDNSLTIPQTDGIHSGPPDSVLLVRDVSNVRSPSTEEVSIHQDFLSVSCSNPCSSTSVNSNSGCPCTDNKALSQSCLPNDIVKESGPDGGIASLYIGHCDGSQFASIGVEDCHDISLAKEYSLEAKRKRKARDILLNFSSPRASGEPITFCSSMDLSLDMNCASNKDNVMSPGNGDASLYGGQSHQGSPENDLSVQVDLETVSFVTSPRNLKKRKISSPKLNHSILSESLEVLDEANMSAPVLSNDDNAIAHPVTQVVENCCDVLPPCMMPMINLHEKSTTRGSFQTESTRDGLSEALAGFEQVPSFPSHMGVGEKEATSFLSMGNVQNDTLGVANRICDKKITVSLDDIAPTKEDSDCCNCLPASNFSAEMKSCIPDMLTQKSSSCQVSNDVVYQVDRTVNEPTVSTGDTIALSVKMSSDNSKADVDEVSRSLPLNIITAPSLPPDSGKLPKISMSSSLPDASKPLHTLKSVPSKSNFSKNKMSSVVPRGFPSSSSVSFTTSKKASIPKHVAKPRTWHRAGNSSSVPGLGSQVSSIRPQSQSLNETMGIRNSYVRKGNTLVRNSSQIGIVAPGYRASSSSVYRLNSSSIKDVKKFKSDNMVQITDPSSSSKTSGSNTISQRLNSEPFICTSNNLGHPTSLPGADQSGSGSLGRKLDGLELTAVKSMKTHSEDAVKSFQSLPDSINKLEGENTSDEGKSRNKMLYLKQGPNPLAAAPDTTPTSSSDGYYKRRTNQLVRTIPENHVNPRIAAIDDSSNSERQGGEKVVTKSQTGLPDSHKSSKFSLVWTLGGTKSSREDGNSLNHKARPYLCSWKRHTNLRSFIHGLGLIRNVGSVSTISQKLLLSRRRQTVYTRSAYGLSLRRSKVLSVGGANLKWSKSIEKNSRKVNQEATLAVAAAEKRKRRQNIIATSTSKSRNNVSRERIFRIGSERYKMDPTGKTLQRISSDEEPAENVLQSESNTKTSYIPRRLLIGNDEYVRVGNGNKLVRNPKRRVRILANQKVRWSLHTARLRLAKKRKYCQFFTRFGKCNKDSGKCPYIHDLSKIAVCTKFLSGSCSNPDCKLTHKVIPERMQDCSYFLQGLCSNGNCPYRHVNVNPNSSVCEGFLRGYCSDGNECQKKHTYVCPSFEATGDCPQGSKCKLHHPKKKSKGLKWGASTEKKNDRGRYFGSPHIDLSECIRAKCSVEGDEGSFFKQGRCVDYISLGFNVEEDEQMVDEASEGSSPLRLQVADFDELVKPIRLLNRRGDSSLCTNSPSEMSTSYVSEESHCKLVMSGEVVAEQCL